MTINSVPNSLPPHSHPQKIYFMGLLVVFTLFYSADQLPPLLKGASQLRAAQIAYENGNYTLAKQNYLLILKKFPSSRAACLGIAEAIFADQTFGNCLNALNYISDLTLNKDEWKRIRKNMPPKLQELFIVKGK